MVKKLSITISDKTNRDYIQSYKGNKSAFIEENFLIGIETEVSELPKYQMMILKIKKENRELREEILKLRLKKVNDTIKNDTEDKALDRKKSFVKGLKNAGMI